MKKCNEEIIVYNGRKLRVIEVIEKGKSQEEIDFELWSNEKYCLEAVKQND